VAKEDRPGVERNYKSIILKNGKITRQEKVENSGAEKAKLFPSDIGMVVTDFLLEYFRDILSYDFTAHIEEKFDEVALGKLEWTRMIDEFYKPFHSLVEKTIKESDYTKGERVLGIDPVSGKPVSVRIGRYGPVVQLGEADASKKTKPQFASLLKGQLIETITLEEALSLFKLPRSLGNYENSEVVVGVGRFGPYVRHQSKFYSLKKDDNPLTIDLNRAVELIEEGRKKERERVIKKFESPQVVEILNGRWGPYISFNKQNYKIPKDKDPKLLTFDDCMKLIDEQAEKGSKRNSTAKKTLPKRQGKKGNTK